MISIRYGGSMQSKAVQRYHIIMLIQLTCIPGPSFPWNKLKHFNVLLKFRLFCIRRNDSRKNAFTIFKKNSYRRLLCYCYVSVRSSYTHNIYVYILYRSYSRFFEVLSTRFFFFIFHFTNPRIPGSDIPLASWFCTTYLHNYRSIIILQWYYETP